MLITTGVPGFRWRIRCRFFIRELEDRTHRKTLSFDFDQLKTAVLECARLTAAQFAAREQLFEFAVGKLFLHGGPAFALGRFVVRLREAERGRVVDPDIVFSFDRIDCDRERVPAIGHADIAAVQLATIARCDPSGPGRRMGDDDRACVQGFKHGIDGRSFESFVLQRISAVPERSVGREGQCIVKRQQGSARRDSLCGALDLTVGRCTVQRRGDRVTVAEVIEQALPYPVVDPLKSKPGDRFGQSAVYEKHSVDPDYRRLLQQPRSVQPVRVERMEPTVKSGRSSGCERIANGSTAHACLHVLRTEGLKIGTAFCRVVQIGKRCKPPGCDVTQVTGEVQDFMISQQYVNTSFLLDRFLLKPSNEIECRPVVRSAVDKIPAEHEMLGTTRPGVLCVDQSDTLQQGE